MGSCASQPINYAGVSVPKVCAFDPVTSMYNIIKGHLDAQTLTTYILDRMTGHLYTYDGTTLLFVDDLPETFGYWDFGNGCDYSEVSCGSITQIFDFIKYTVFDADVVDQCNMPNGTQGDEVVDQKTSTYYTYDNDQWLISRTVSFIGLYLWGQFNNSIFNDLYMKKSCGQPLVELSKDTRVFDLGNFQYYFWCEDNNRWQREDYT